MGFVRSPDCYLDLHQISASTYYTRYEIHTLSSTRLGPAGHVSQKYYGMVRPRGAEEGEREELYEDWDATVAKDGRRVGGVIR